MKKLVSALLMVLMLVTVIGCFASCGDDDFKVGVILIGDETEGYTKAHMDGINAAKTSLGLSDEQIIWKKTVPENSACTEAAEDLVAQGCSVIFSNSYGHQDFMVVAAKNHPEVQFVSATGDFAAISGADNFSNAFTEVYQSRYVSGIVAGMKIKELVENNQLAAENLDNGKVKVGYVGAYNYAEVVSGYTAFFLGIQSVYPDVTMEVKYTDSWFDFDKEATAAEYLVNRGCVIIGQHADSEGAPRKCEALLAEGKLCYSVGYNVDMLGCAPNAALTSATNNWAVFYTYAIRAALNGEKIETDWHEGYTTGAVAITPLGQSCAEGTQAKVDEAIEAIKAGTLKVFDTSKFTVTGANVENFNNANLTLDADGHVTSAMIDLSYRDWANGGVVVYQGQTLEAIKDGEFEESVLRSAPYFAIRIDGITETAADGN